MSSKQRERTDMAAYRGDSSPQNPAASSTQQEFLPQLEDSQGDLAQFEQELCEEYRPSQDGSSAMRSSEHFEPKGNSPPGAAGDQFLQHGGQETGLQRSPPLKNVGHFSRPDEQDPLDAVADSFSYGKPNKPHQTSTSMPMTPANLTFASAPSSSTKQQQTLLEEGHSQFTPQVLVDPVLHQTPNSSVQKTSANKLPFVHPGYEDPKDIAAKGFGFAKNASRPNRNDALSKQVQAPVFHRAPGASPREEQPQPVSDRSIHAFRTVPQSGNLSGPENASPRSNSANVRTDTAPIDEDRGRNTSKNHIRPTTYPDQSDTKDRRSTEKMHSSNRLKPRCETETVVVTGTGRQENGEDHDESDASEKSNTMTHGSEESSGGQLDEINPEHMELQGESNHLDGLPFPDENAEEPTAHHGEGQRPHTNSANNERPVRGEDFEDLAAHQNVRSYPDATLRSHVQQSTSAAKRPGHVSREPQRNSKLDGTRSAQKPTTLREVPKNSSFPPENSKRGREDRRAERTESSQRPQESRHRAPPGDLAFQSKKPVAAPITAQSQRSSPGTRQMNRPVRRDMNQEKQIAQTVLRPQSSASNISKLRQPHSRQKHRRDPQQRHELLPMRQRMSEEFKNLSCSWNQYFGYNSKYAERVDAMLAESDEYVESLEQKCQELEHKLEEEGQHVEGLEQERDDLQSQVQHVSEKLTNSSSKIKKLDEKCRVYKERLNSATQEHQKLYTKTKESFANAVAEIQKEEQGRKDSMAHALKHSELVRADIQKKIATVAQDAKQRFHQLEKTITTLEGQLESGTKELAKEREIVRGLEKELNESRQQNSSILQTLSNQNERILKKMEEKRGHAEDAEFSVCEQNEKLNTAMDVLEEVRAKVSNPTELIEKVRVLEEEGVTNILGAIKEIASQRHGANTDTEALSASIKSVQDLCEGISEQVRIEKQYLELRERHQKAIFDMQLLQEAKNAAEEKAEETEEKNSTWIESNEQLRKQLEDLRLDKDLLNNLVAAEKTHHQEEVSALKEQLLQLDEANKERRHLQGEVAGLRDELGGLQADSAAKNNGLRERITKLGTQLASREKQLEESTEKSREQIDSLQKQLQSRRDQSTEEVTQLQEKVANLENQLSSHQRQEKEDNELQARIGELEAQLAKRDEEKRQVDNQLREKTSELASLSDQVASREEDSTQTTRLQQQLSAEKSKVQLANEKVQVLEEESRKQSQQLQDALNAAARQKDEVVAVNNENKQLAGSQRRLKKSLEVSERSRANLDKDFQDAIRDNDALRSNQATVNEDFQKLRETVEEQVSHVGELTRGLEASQASRERLESNMEEWSRDRKKLADMEKLFQTLKTDHEDVLNMIATRSQQSGRTTQVEFQQTQATAQAPVLTSSRTMTQEESSSPLSSLMSPMAPSPPESLSLNRRVVVRSPADIDEAGALPLSVNEEREARRQADPPRGIIKRHTTGSSPTEMDVQRNAEHSQRQQTEPAARKRNAAKPAMTTHSSYNRPVLGGTASKGKTSSPMNLNSSGKRPRVEVSGIETSQSQRPNRSQDYTQSNRASLIPSNNSQDQGIKRQRTTRNGQDQGSRQASSSQDELPGAASRFFRNENDDIEASDNDQPISRLEVLPPNIGERGGRLRRAPSRIRTYGSQGGQNTESQTSVASGTMTATDSQRTMSQGSQQVDSQGSVPSVDSQERPNHSQDIFSQGIPGFDNQGVTFMSGSRQNQGGGGKDGQESMRRTQRQPSRASARVSGDQSTQTNNQGNQSSQRRLSLRRTTK